MQTIIIIKSKSNKTPFSGWRSLTWKPSVSEEREWGNVDVWGFCWLSREAEEDEGREKWWVLIGWLGRVVGDGGKDFSWIEVVITSKVVIPWQENVTAALSRPDVDVTGCWEIGISEVIALREGDDDDEDGIGWTDFFDDCLSLPSPIWPSFCCFSN